MTVHRARAHAKINLFLRVLGRRPDGFHELESVMHSVSLADEVALTLRPGAAEVEVSGASIPPEDNLALRAARLLDPDGGVHIEIVKSIPVGGGLAGGSADAAATLLLLNDARGMGLGAQELAELGAQLGSDVPFSLSGGTAIVTGRGERVMTIPAPTRLWFVLGIFDAGISTADAYRLWDERAGAPAERHAADFVAALAAGDIGEVAGLLHNDLEEVALYLHPELARAKSVLIDAGALGASVSGSGPTVFALAASEKDARAIAEKVRAHFDRVEVATSVFEGVSKVDGRDGALSMAAEGP